MSFMQVLCQHKMEKLQDVSFGLKIKSPKEHRERTRSSSGGRHGHVTAKSDTDKHRTKYEVELFT